MDLQLIRKSITYDYQVRTRRKNFIGEAKIMDTPYGKIVKGLIDEACQLGVSSRGMGSLVQKNG